MPNHSGTVIGQVVANMPRNLLRLIVPRYNFTLDVQVSSRHLACHPPLTAGSWVHVVGQWVTLLPITNPQPPYGPDDGLLLATYLRFVTEEELQRHPNGHISSDEQLTTVTGRCIEAHSGRTIQSVVLLQQDTQYDVNWVTAPDALVAEAMLGHLVQARGRMNGGDNEIQASELTVYALPPITPKDFTMDSIMVLEDLRDDIEQLVADGKCNRRTKTMLESMQQRVADVLAVETKPKAKVKRARARRGTIERTLPYPNTHYEEVRRASQPEMQPAVITDEPLMTPEWFNGTAILSPADGSGVIIGSESLAQDNSQLIDYSYARAEAREALREAGRMFATRTATIANESNITTNIS